MSIPREHFLFAGFWNRFIAYVIDQSILAMIRGIVLIPFYHLIQIQSWFGDDERDLYFASYFKPEQIQNPFDEVFLLIFAFFGLIAINAFIGWLYYSLFESSEKMGSPGKLLFGIKVVDFQGNKISFSKATGRYFGKYISALIIFIGFIMAAFTEYKQALHDILVNCYVITGQKEIINQDFSELKKADQIDYII